ncbi:MAG: CHAT domain-containing protein [Thiothrix sp.]|uniref:CHAT domain-containing protein n=1 Tax=Thiothrix sp. TaxID=1032 RepID=UPI002623D5BC|nr:CHAT domain-containing protein [Thiothrix sp.]MDD5391561.1 CHAT domain-containing protein [Thiothrix sp.]
MSAKSYLNFDLLLNEAGDNYQVHVIDSPAGQASRTFTLPFSAVELENFILKIGQNRGSVRSLYIERIDVPSIQKLGGALYEALFGGAIAERFRSSLAIARREGCGLRIRLRLSGAPKLIDIPWELLFDADNNNYIGLSVNTPIIRKLDLATLPEIRQAQGVLQVLVMISSPSNYQQLDVEREWDRINSATLSLQKEGRMVLTRVEPSLVALQRQLRRGEYHVFHYIGHGGFDRTNNDGVLVLEDQQKKGHLVSGQYLGTILYDETTLQLVLLNSCSGGRTSVTDPFAGVGQSLLQKGIPAVIAMQFEITDDAAITFSHEFYAALVDGYSIDASVAEARKMIYAEANQLEWATPVLYTSIDSGSLLREPTPEELHGMEEQRRQREEAKHQAELKHQQEEEARQLELKRQQEEEAKRQSELKRQQEEAKRQAEVKHQQEEDAKRQAELRRQQEEAKRQAEVKHQQEEDAKRQAELRRQQEEEVKRQAELKRQQEEKSKRQAELKRQEEEAAKHQAELKRQEEDAAKRQAKLQAELKRQQEEEAKHQAELKHQQEEIEHQEELKHQQEVSYQVKPVEDGMQQQPIASTRKYLYIGAAVGLVYAILTFVLSLVDGFMFMPNGNEWLIAGAVGVANILAGAVVAVISKGSFKLFIGAIIGIAIFMIMYHIANNINYVSKFFVGLFVVTPLGAVIGVFISKWMLSRSG